MQGKVLGEMRRRRSLPAAALEVHHRDDLKVLFPGSMRQVATPSPRPVVEEISKALNIVDRVAPTAVFHRRRDSLLVRYSLAQVGFVDAEKPRGFGWAEGPYGLFG